MIDMYDSMGTFAGSVTENGLGHQVFEDQLGQTMGTFEPGIDGGGTFRDSMGHTVAEVQETVGGHEFHDPQGGLMGTASTDPTGQTSFRDSTGAMTGTFDPMTGNMSNAIGEVTDSVQPRM